MSVRQLIEALNDRLRGHYNFYGVIGNYGSLCSFLNQTRRVLRKWLGRRSQKGRLGWERFTALGKLFPLEPPRTFESRHRQLVLGGSC
jgi:RNA-directed DNA polymerase